MNATQYVGIAVFSLGILFLFIALVSGFFALGLRLFPTAAWLLVLGITVTFLSVVVERFHELIDLRRHKK